MKEYFLLQYKMTTRKFRDGGLHPLLGYVLGLGGLVGVFQYLFNATEHARYLALLAPLSILLRLTKASRSEFLLSTFGKVGMRYIRVFENLILCFPFAILLIYNGYLLEATSLLLSGILLVFVRFNSGLSFVMPTPFGRYPFEFVTGFRRTFFLFPFFYYLVFMAVTADNVNLGIFSMMLVFLVSSSYYVKPEHEYYVWIYSEKPGRFLLKKLATATLCSLILNLPIIVALCVFYPGYIGIVALFFLIGLFFLATIILAKYAAYPNEIGLLEAFLIGTSIYFPPLLLALIPFFYNNSVNRLNRYLR